MTFPEGLPSTLQPTDIHDATWGVVSAVYGGAVHPTAEGHAAMADAALAAARRVLGIQANASVSGEPLPPPREIVQ
jgi:phospholipase/lecithinase/hemolysin